MFLLQIRQDFPKPADFVTLQLKAPTPHVQNWWKMQISLEKFAVIKQKFAVIKHCKRWTNTNFRSAPAQPGYVANIYVT